MSVSTVSSARHIPSGVPPTSLNLRTSPFKTSPLPGESAHISAEATSEHHSSTTDQMAKLGQHMSTVGHPSTTHSSHPTTPGSHPGSVPGAHPTTHHLSRKAENLKKGKNAVKIASKHLGQSSINVHMPNYSHAGGVTNDCADFVSGALSDAGLFKKKSQDVNVEDFRNDLQAQGWKKVSKSQAQPGDVAILLGDGIEHTELVASKGATNNIGSNGTSVESVSHDNLDWASRIVSFYAPPGGG